ncbi:MAG: hypothetical protein LBP73_04875 [Clostridiales Family XIII bacterium]|jgi:hypothetical protein|nr:hypothetical protein [Clostridiales Family XIII bacterium]
MNHCGLLLDNNKPMLEIARAEWRKHGIGIVDVKAVSEAIEELPTKPYALIIVVADHVGAAMCSMLKTLLKDINQNHSNAASVLPAPGRAPAKMAWGLISNAPWDP